MTAHRRPPLPHWKSPRGQCRWCGQAVLRDGQPDKRRNWHDGRAVERNCLLEFQIACHSEHMRQAVFGRDRGICAKCGADAEKPTGIKYNSHPIFHEGRAWCSATRQHSPICRFEYKTLDWIADHVLPLWMVPREGVWEDVIKYWSLDNLQTLCTPCNKIKTAKDQGAIAKVKRLKAPRLHSTMRSGPKLQSRGFNKEWSRRFNGTVVPRKKAGAGAESAASAPSIPRQAA